MVKGKLTVVSISFIIVYLIALFLLPKIDYFSRNELTLNYFHLGFYLILMFGIFLGLSAFLPYTWGNSFREISYFFLFVSILIAEMAALHPFFNKINVNAERCKNVFSPSTNRGVVFDALAYSSCILSGYYPSEKSSIGWVTFFIFYLILPFAFIWILMYGLMQGMGMEEWFGGRYGFGKNAVRLLSFIIALFATRVIMGEVLLEFLGYGAWGLAGIFIAIFLVGGVKHMINNWYSIEEMGEKTRKIIESEIKLKRESIKNLKMFVKKRGTVLTELITPGADAYHRIFVHLPDEMKGRIREIIENPTIKDKRSEIMKLIGHIEKSGVVEAPGPSS